MKLSNHHTANMTKRKRIKVIHTKLGRERAWGQAHIGEFSIEVDIRQHGKKLLETYIHESFHLLFPEAEEEEVETKAIILTNLLWSQQYRRVDNTNLIQLQDGRT